MLWQDLVFLLGNVFSLVVLVPTLRDPLANVPLGTALPSAFIGLVYGTAFFTLGMSYSAFGAVVTGAMWSVIAVFRSPNPLTGTDESEVETLPSPRSPAPGDD